MSESGPPSPAPDTKQSGGELASNDRARRTRTRSMVLIGLAIVGLFLILLVAGLVPRIRNQRELAAAAQKVQSALPQVYVIRPQPAAEAGLSLNATTQAIQDSIIYARTSGYLRKRYVDIGDRVTAGQLLAEVDSPEIEQQLRQAKADLQQSERNRDLQKANLDLAKVTMARYEAADAEGAVAKQALDQSVSTHRTAQAAVAAAEANVESNRANVQRLQEMTSFQRILAPFNGTVIHHSLNNILWERDAARRIVNVPAEEAAREFTEILLRGVIAETGGGPPSLRRDKKDGRAAARNRNGATRNKKKK